MIGRLKGIVASIGDDGIVLDVGGVGYELFCAARLQAALSPGEAAELIVETHVREDHIHLYGFASHAEREWFRKLTGVQRVGSKAALTILDALPPDALLQAILARDTTAFSRIHGIGAKLAERIIAELKDKVSGSKMQISSAKIKEKTPAIPASQPATTLDDVISALTNLGYGRSEAYSAAATAMKDAEADAGVDILIRRSLKELA